MRRLWGGLIAAALVSGAALPAHAGTALDARDTAYSACQERPTAKKVTITVAVGSRSRRFTFRCAQLAAPPPTITKPKAYTPVPTDFQIGVVTLKQACYEEAGCNVTYRIDVKYVGTSPPDVSKTFDVVYTVTGGDAPQINHFTLTGPRVSYPSQEEISTPQDPVLAAAVTNVLER